MDAPQSPSAQSPPNGKKWLAKFRLRVGEMVVSFKTLTFLVIALTGYWTIRYQNELALLSLLSTAFYLLWHFRRESKRRKPTTETQAESDRKDCVQASGPGLGRLFAALALTATFFSNGLLLNFGLLGERVAVIEGLNESQDVVMKSSQPRFFLPSVYKLSYYDVDQTLISDCRGELESADGTPYLGVISLRLSLNSDPDKIKQIHELFQGDEELLKMTLQGIVCAFANVLLKHVQPVWEIQSSTRFVGKKINERLDNQLKVFGVRREPRDYLTFISEPGLNIGDPPEAE